MRIKTALIILSILSIVMSAAGGCGGRIHFPKVYPLRVTVKTNGAPVEKALVAMNPTEKIGNFTILGETDAHGVCDIATIAVGRKKKGVPAGDYRVTVVYQGKNTNTPEEAAEFDRRTEGMTLDQVIAEAEKESDARKKRNEELSMAIPLCVRTLDETPITRNVPSESSEWTIELTEYAD